MSEISKRYPHGARIFFPFFIILSALVVPLTSYAAECNTSQVAANDSMRFGYNDSTEKLGTTKFVAPLTCFVTAIGVSVEGITSPVDHMTVKLYTDGGGTPGTLLETGSNIDGGVSFAWATSTFSGATQITSGNNYYIVLGRTGVDSPVTYYRWEAQDSNVGGVIQHGTIGSMSNWDASGASAKYSVSGTTDGGGGGGGSSATSTDATSTVEQTQTNLWYAYWTFFATLIFIVWLFRGTKR